MIVDSVQSDVMQVNRAVKELSLDSKHHNKLFIISKTYRTVVLLSIVIFF